MQAAALDAGVLNGGILSWPKGDYIFSFPKLPSNYAKQLSHLSPDSSVFGISCIQDEAQRRGGCWGQGGVMRKVRIRHLTKQTMHTPKTVHSRLHPHQYATGILSFDCPCMLYTLHLEISASSLTVIMEVLLYWQILCSSWCSSLPLKHLRARQW